MTEFDPRHIEERLPLRNLEEERFILGPYDRHARVLRELYKVTIGSRDGTIKIAGEASAVRAVREKLDSLLRRTRAGEMPDEASVMRLLSTVVAEPHEAALPRRSAYVSDGARGADVHRAGEHAPKIDGHARTFAEVQPRTPGQARYMDAIRDHSLTIATGPAGSGKTFLAVAMAIESLRRGEYKKLVLARPAVEAGEKLGFLPGDLQAKVNPYLRPLYDALNDLLDPSAARRYVENDVIEICPLAYMRGRTLNGSFMILDEAQNTTPKQMQMFLTRMGERSRIVVTGDATQVDLPDKAVSGLTDACRRLSGVEGVAVVELGKADIVRHALVSRIVEAYEQ